jgi:hypothetical protein
MSLAVNIVSFRPRAIPAPNFVSPAVQESASRRIERLGRRVHDLLGNQGMGEQQGCADASVGATPASPAISAPTT